MENQIELAIDLAAVTMLVEMYPASTNTKQVANLIQKIASKVEEQPSAEMLIDFLVKKYA